MASRSATKLSTPLLRGSVVPRTSVRRLSTRPHPLASRPTPSGPVAAGATPRPLKPRQQKWSTLTAILLATLTGTTTYVLGLRSNSSTPQPAPTQAAYQEPTRDRFNAAMEEVRASFPSDCISDDRDALVAHGHSAWAAHDPKGLPGAVLYPRDTQDVVRMVKLASKYGIPLIPYCAGTSLEGQERIRLWPQSVDR